MTKFMMIGIVAGTAALFATAGAAQAECGCGCGSEHVYSPPGYSYNSPPQVYAAPLYSYGTGFGYGYSQRSYGFQPGIRLGFGRGYHSGHVSQYGRWGGGPGSANHRYHDLH